MRTICRYQFYNVYLFTSPALHFIIWSLVIFVSRIFDFQDQHCNRIILHLVLMQEATSHITQTVSSTATDKCVESRRVDCLSDNQILQLCSRHPAVLLFCVAGQQMSLIRCFSIAPLCKTLYFELVWETGRATRLFSHHAVHQSHQATF